MASRDALYSKFGITAEAAQLFEVELGNLLLFAEGLDRRWHVKPEPQKGLETLRKIDRSTMGQLLTKLQKWFSIDENISNLFSSALRCRNRLNHGFYERHNYSIQTDEGRDVMVADLEILHQNLFEAWQIASAMSSMCFETLVQAKFDATGVQFASSTELPKRPDLPAGWPWSTES